VTGAIADGLHLIEVPLGTRRNSIYLIEGSDSLLLFDTGVAGQLEQYLLPYLAGIGRSVTEISHVIVSHCDIDHWGGTADARRLAPQAQLLAHADDAVLIGHTELTIADRYQEFQYDHGIGWNADFLELLHERSSPVELDGHLEAGERIDLGGRTVEVLHVPGHSRGHLALWDLTASALIVADALLGDGVPDYAGVPALPPNYRYPAAYLATSALLASYDADWLLTAHYAPKRPPEAARFIAASAAYCELVERLLLGELAPTPATVIDLVRTLQHRLGPWPEGEVDFGVASMLVGHLEEAVIAGTVTTERTPQSLLSYRLKGTT